MITSRSCSTLVRSSVAGRLLVFLVLSLLALDAAAAVAPNRMAIASRANGKAMAQGRANLARSVAQPDSVGFSGWSTGSCPSLLPGAAITRATPGDVNAAWASLEQNAIATVEKIYGQTPASDPSNDVALGKARGVTRALMFGLLVQAINDVAHGTPTADQANWVSGYQGVVAYGRLWMALDARNRYVAWTESQPVVSSFVNTIVNLVASFVGLPWRDDVDAPHAEEFIGQAEDALWGSPATTAEPLVGGGTLDAQNYPLSTAEAAYALEQMREGLLFLNAIGQTQVVAPDGDPALSTAMAGIENAIGALAGEEFGEAVLKISEIGDFARGERGMPYAAVVATLVKDVFLVVESIFTVENINAAVTKAQQDTTPYLPDAFQDANQLTELMNDFVAITLHSRPDPGGGTGNDPDCRIYFKNALPSPPAPDATLTVSHHAGPTQDYVFQTPVLGGPTGPVAPPDAISYPAMVNWSYARDSGPGAPRLGANWPISQISYGIPGEPQKGTYSVGPPSPWFPTLGYWYITFNGSDGLQHTTYPLYVGRYAGDVLSLHPTDSEVAEAIVAADPADFSCNPLAHSSDDPALNPKDKANWPCLDWFADYWKDPPQNTIPNDKYHSGTMLIVSGNQPDGNILALANYQVIFNIMVKGDLGDWTPIFVGHGGLDADSGSSCKFTDVEPVVAVGGVCLRFGEAGVIQPGDVVESKVVWERQTSDECQTDPLYCQHVPSYGWPAPYTPDKYRECQSVSPADNMFVIEYIGTVNPQDPTNSCANAPVAGSWASTPNIRYRSMDGNLWTAWRLPSSGTLGSWNFLNIEAAVRSTGTAGVVDTDSLSKSGMQIAGNGTNWTQEFRSGDNIWLVDRDSGQHNKLGGLLSVIRTIDHVIDDTHMQLTTSVECLNRTDGNDCDMFAAVGYTSYMNPLDGSDGGADQMVNYCPPSPEGCLPTPQEYPFDIYRVATLNPGTDCTTWNDAIDPHPPASGCYYSNTVQFQAQTYAGDSANDLWWNISLPALSPQPPAAAAARTAGLEPWLGQPHVTQQPLSVMAPAGSNVAFTAAATGSPTPGVQWQKSTDHGATWNAIGGATATTYNLNAVTQGLSGSAYRAVFTNTHGTRTTQAATLGISSAPQITASPASVLAAQPGDVITLTGTASGVPEPTATWQLSSDNGTTWTDKRGAPTAISFVMPPPPVTQLLARVRYSNVAGSATSQTAVVTADRIFNNGVDPTHCAVVANTFDIYWDEVDGIKCSGIEHTNGTLADAQDGSFSMNGLSVSAACLAPAAYSFTLTPDKHALVGSDTANNVPMTLTSDGNGCFVGHWVSGSYDLIATFWNFTQP